MFKLDKNAGSLSEAAVAILSAYGPSGREEEVAKVIEAQIAPWCDQVYRDPLGNLIGFKKGTSGKKIMITTHMDQIGMIVADIDDEGFLYVGAIGAVDPAMAAGRVVTLPNGVRGVTYYGNKKPLGEVKFADLYIDIGAASREEAEKYVHIGDMAVLGSEILESETCLSAAAMDDRIGCILLAESLPLMNSPHDIYAVFTVQEEVGTRGSSAPAYTIRPDLNITMDVTRPGDTPDCPRMSVRLGKGPAVKNMDWGMIVPQSLYRFIKDVACQEGIPCQDEVLLRGETDAGAVQRTAGGIVSGCISIPCRYVHSPVETVNKADLENVKRLLLACCKQDALPV